MSVIASSFNGAAQYIWQSSPVHSHIHALVRGALRRDVRGYGGHLIDGITDECGMGLEQRDSSEATIGHVNAPHQAGVHLRKLSAIT